MHARDGDDESIRMRQRQRCERAGDAGHVRGLPQAATGVPQLRVGERDASSAAGGPARVHERGEIVVGAVHDRRITCRFEAFEGHRLIVAGAGDHHMVQRRNVHRGAASRAQQLVRGQHRGRAGVVEHVAELLRGHQEHHRGDRRAGPPQRVVGDQHLGAVGHQDGDAIAGLNAQVTQAGGQALRPFHELG